MFSGVRVSLEIPERGIAMGDTYNVYGGQGIGRHAHIENAEMRMVVLGDQGDPALLHSQVQDVLRATEEDDIDEPAVALGRRELQAVSSAVESEDWNGAAGHLRRAGAWALERANDVGAALLAAAIQKSMGM